MIDISIVANQVARATSLLTSEADVERVLSATRSTSELWQIVDLSDRPFNVVVETIKQLRKEGLVDFDGPRISLSAAGEELCDKRGILPRTLHRCSSCEGRGISLQAFDHALRRFVDMAGDRPVPIENFDQAYVTAETTLARVALMAERGDLAGKRLLVLGDDDLVGIAAALTGLPRLVVVLEVDDRLVDFIETKSKENNLRIEVLRHDLRLRLPEYLLGRFDCFFTDPPDTLPGLELFVARGLAALCGDGCAGYFGVTLVESSLRKWRDFQRALVNKFGVVVTDVNYDFSTYVNWDYLVGSVRDDIEPLRHKPTKPWYKSSLYRIETLSDSVKTNEDAEEEGLYTCRENLISTREMRNAIDP